MEKIEKISDEFITQFSAQIAALIPHDFIAKQQSMYLNSRKDQLQKGEYVIISDFSENYSFVIQVNILKSETMSAVNLRTLFYNIVCRMRFNRIIGPRSNAQSIHSQFIIKTTMM